MGQTNASKSEVACQGNISIFPESFLSASRGYSKLFHETENVGQDRWREAVSSEEVGVSEKCSGRSKSDFEITDLRFQPEQTDDGASAAREITDSFSGRQ